MAVSASTHTYRKFGWNGRKAVSQHALRVSRRARSNADGCLRSSLPISCEVAAVSQPHSRADRHLGPPKVFMASLVALMITTLTLTLAPMPAHASIGEALAHTLNGVAPAWLIVILLAAAPVVELRGAIPLGIAVFGMHPVHTLALAILGNFAPVPIIFGSLGPLTQSVSKAPAAKRVVDALLRRAKKMTTGWGEGDVFWALALFVGVPLPGTGAWTGAMASWVLGMPFAECCMANFVGVVIAGVLVTALSCMGWAGLWTAVIVLLVVPVISFLVKSMQQR